jgi:hypothetical protein
MNTHLAYLAGLIDGEGSFSLQVDIRSYKGVSSVRFNPRISMTLYYGTEVLDELAGSFGGKVYSYKNGQKRWIVSRKEDLIIATMQLLPYLRIKKQIATRFLEGLKLFPQSRKAHVNGERSWSQETTLKVAEIALTLNPYRKSSKTLEYLDTIKREVYKIS